MPQHARVGLRLVVAVVVFASIGGLAGCSTEDDGEAPLEHVERAITTEHTVAALRRMEVSPAEPWPFFYETAEGVLWRLTDSRAPRPSPFDDRFLAYGLRDGVPVHTLLVDLRDEGPDHTWTVESILPVPMFPVRWEDAERVLLRYEGEGTSADALPWPTGFYRLDLESATIQLVREVPPTAVAAFSFDARYLLTFADDAATDGEGSSGATDATLVVEEVATGETWRLPWDSPGTAVEAAWSPVANRLAFVGPAGRELWLWDAAQDGHSSPVLPPEHAPLQDIRWSSNGQSLSVASGSDAAVATIIIESATGRAGTAHAGAMPMAWSPDGVRLAVLSDYCTDHGFRLAIVDTAAIPEALRRIEDDYGSGWSFAAWSTAGREIVAGGVGQHVMLIDPVTGLGTPQPAFGTGQKRNTFYDYPSTLRWSATDRFLTGDIAFGRGRCEGAPSR